VAIEVMLPPGVAGFDHSVRLASLQLWLFDLDKRPRFALDPVFILFSYGALRTQHRVESRSLRSTIFVV
jgi:hypothetical protein